MDYIKMDSSAIYDKFGDDYLADEDTFLMGIDQRFTSHFAERLSGLTVLETCTGAGFTTISLARTAKHVFTVEINSPHMEKAISNIQKAGLSSKVSFINGSIMATEVLSGIPAVDAAFIDPDWAVTGPEHIHRFIQSKTKPPADLLLAKILEITEHVAMVLPPSVEVREFDGLAQHERQKTLHG